MALGTTRATCTDLFSVDEVSLSLDASVPDADGPPATWVIRRLLYQLLSLILSEEIVEKRSALHREGNTTLGRTRLRGEAFLEGGSRCRLCSTTIRPSLCSQL